MQKELGMSFRKIIGRRAFIEKKRISEIQQKISFDMLKIHTDLIHKQTHIIGNMLFTIAIALSGFSIHFIMQHRSEISFIKALIILLPYTLTIIFLIFCYLQSNKGFDNLNIGFMNKIIYNKPMNLDEQSKLKNNFTILKCFQWLIILYILLCTLSCLFMIYINIIGCIIISAFLSIPLIFIILYFL